MCPSVERRARHVSNEIGGEESCPRAASDDSSRSGLSCCSARGAISPPCDANYRAVDVMVERLAASGRMLQTGVGEPLRMSHRSLKLSAESRRFSGVMRQSRELQITAGVPSYRAPAARWCVAGLTSLFTKLRLPNRKTRPPLRTVITLALRKREHRTRTGAGRGTCTLAQIRQSRCHRAGISFV